MEKWYRKRKFGFLLLTIFLTGTMSFMYRLQSRFTFQMLGKAILKNTLALPTHSQIQQCNATCKMEGGIWTIKPDGRLGNQMGEYATLYALAKLNGHRAYIAPEMYNVLSPIFKISLPVIEMSELIEIQWNNYWLHDWMSEEYKHIEGKNVKLTGYPCSWTFYHHIRDEILKEFTFHDYIKEEVNAYLEKLKGFRKNVTYVGVHVRRGDYVHVMPNTWKGVIADKGYLDKAMAYFRETYQEPVFVVASNGMQWCKDNIDNSKGDVYFSGDGIESSPGKDFALLAHCNHTIMTIGTFGYWAGYLAGGMTIYLKDFTLPDSPFLKLFRYEAAFLPQWMGVPADLSPLTGK
ncbi:galactoside alpha-(1,2)-fucosyltransferase 2-like [Ambystoma mexicanum]|uniref:galactoside alpha-(1,2)-fucosyltransferase 2-like n=1 Tax=Ambystoma mexicanum TaxID=8296 RepID=UPI0037E8B485